MSDLTMDCARDDHRNCQGSLPAGYHGQERPCGCSCHRANGVDLIAEERARQVADEGWSPEHDDTHDGGELAIAALCYADPRNGVLPAGQSIVAPIRWPWAAGWWKPADRVRMLAKAGALIAAEIDRLQRLETRP